MKTLLILRHAKSSWNNPRLADHDRPLNERGRADAPRMGVLLRREDLVPDLIVSSTATRAARTAEAVADACGYGDDIVYTRALYHAPPEAYLSLLAELDAPAARIMVVGHNPGVEELLEELCGRHERMPTAALAQVALRLGRWGALSAETPADLVNLWYPRDL